MTMVHIRLRAPTNGGTRAGVGMVVFQPSARHTDDASVVLPDTFTVVLDEEGEATVDIQPTGPDWCWKTDEQVPYGSIRWFTVPDTAGTLEYAELTDVDPRTFKPGRNLAAWQAVTGDIKTMIDSMPRYQRLRFHIEETGGFFYIFQTPSELATHFQGNRRRRLTEGFCQSLLIGVVVAQRHAHIAGNNLLKREFRRRLQSSRSTHCCCCHSKQFNTHAMRFTI